MNPVLMVQNEMLDYWTTCPQGCEDETEFLQVLHNPLDEETMRDAIRDMCFACPDLTDEQWKDVLNRLRLAFPIKADCEECYDPACGTYGPDDVPLCADCRDDGGWCSCGVKVNDCEFCAASEEDE